MDQLDLICSQCPLTTCDEKSLWCLHRFMTRPNGKQRRLMSQIDELTPGALSAKPRTAEQIRQAKYYQDNRDRKLAAANARHQQNREREAV